MVVLDTNEYSPRLVDGLQEKQVKKQAPLPKIVGKIERLAGELELLYRNGANPKKVRAMAFEGLARLLASALPRTNSGKRR